ncbi:MAG TPA: hypothetical protein VLL54_05200 [Pyrinomonadaceae bacterium]|nr:hypothetical protein [Pyrinomonadaceae bacterium]
METVAGIFKSRTQAEDAIRQIHSLGIANDRIALLTPGMSEGNIERTVPTADSEQPGMGPAMGGTVGGAMGVAGGATLGAVAASVLVPGVGPVIAGGILGAAILGAGGAAAGAAAGQALESGLETGLPHDELYLYEDALRQGRSVVVAFVDDKEKEPAVHNALARGGAESIDQARENWWIGIRDDEEVEYQSTGRTFKTDEPSYRSGFETAVKSHSWWASQKELTAAPADFDDDVFRRGYERGLSYCKLRENRKA